MRNFTDKSRRRRLEGSVAVVTGASSGVGRAIAYALAAEGAQIALIARGIDGLRAAASDIEQRGGKALVFSLDVTDADAVQRAGDDTVRAWGKIDIWVNDAMVSVFAEVPDVLPSEFRRVIEVNYLGYVHGTQTALRHMRDSDHGVIVQVGSALAYRSIPLQSAYCASKAAIRGFTDSLRSELLRRESGIHITMLQLPAVNTPQFEVVRNKLSKHAQPVPPMYQPEVIAAAAVDAVLRPSRERWIGWSASLAILGQKFFPGLLDRYLMHEAWESQTTEQLPSGHPHEHVRDNVDAPIPGDRGVHGPFDRRARSFSLQVWLRRYAAQVSLGAAAVALLAWWLS